MDAAHAAESLFYYRIPTCSTSISEDFLPILSLRTYSRRVSRQGPAGPHSIGTGGTGVTSNHDNDAHRGSDSVFYSLI